MRALKIEVSLTRKSAVLDKYLNELSKIELLTVEQEVDLCARIQARDQAALNKLVESNLRFVVSVAKKYQCAGFALEDLICEGKCAMSRTYEFLPEGRGRSKQMTSRPNALPEFERKRGQQHGIEAEDQQRRESG